MIVTVAQARNKREHQEDCARVVRIAAGYVAVIADGMGGHSYGEEASSAAVDAAIREMRRARLPEPLADDKPVSVARKLIRHEQWGRIAGALMRAITGASDAVAALGRGMHKPPDTTLIVALIQPRRAWFASVGDSFAAVHGEIVTPLDHLPCAPNVLTSTIGSLDQVTLVSRERPFVWTGGDGRVVLATDGLVKNGEPWIGDRHDDALTLVRAGLASGESADNITAIVIAPGEQASARQWKPTIIDLEGSRV